MSVITLLTDFGFSEYPSMMKGVILSRHPEAVIIDISHSITRQNILQGAFVLKNTVRYFPEGTIHIGVVDPGVGSARKPIAIECEKGTLIGPDNGLLIPAAAELGLKKIYVISNNDISLPEVSGTFHGRDVFAPAAAFISKKPGRIVELGEVLTTPAVELKLPEPAVDKNHVKGIVMHIDSFGNIITNVQLKDFNSLLSDLVRAGSLKLAVNGQTFNIVFKKTYSEGEPVSITALMSSSGHLEFALLFGSAAESIGVKAGDGFELNIDD